MAAGNAPDVTSPAGRAVPVAASGGRHRVRVRTVLVRAGPGNLPPVRVGCHGQVHELSSGQTLCFRLGPAAEGAAAAPVA
jgi:hypothetical protein